MNKFHFKIQFEWYLMNLRTLLLHKKAPVENSPTKAEANRQTAGIKPLLMAWQGVGTGQPCFALSFYN
jgi:hypothetical protein